MKKLLLLFLLALAVNSCSVGDDTNAPLIVVLPIESVVMDDIYQVGVESEILITYRRPTDCHIFDGFYIQSGGNVRTVAIQAVKLDQGTCLDDTDNSFEIPLKFIPETSGNYTFRFYTGETSGNSDYLEYEVTVE